MLFDTTMWFFAIGVTTWLLGWAFSGSPKAVPGRVPAVAGAVALVGMLAARFVIGSRRNRHAPSGTDVHASPPTQFGGDIAHESETAALVIASPLTGADQARSGDGAENPPLLRRKSVLLGMLTSGFVITNAAGPSAAAHAATKPIAAAQPAYAPIWKPSTPYALGQQVISPNNDVVSANIAHTSAQVYVMDTAKWALSAAYRPLSRLVTVMMTHGSTAARYAAYLDDFLRWNYTTIGPDDLWRFLNGDASTMPAKPLLLTFDDGYLSQYENCYPAIRDRGMKATFYVVPDFIDGVLSQAEGGFTEAAAMSWANANEMRAHGMRIQSHGKIHRRYGIDLTPVQCVADFLAAKSRIETMVPGETVNHMAYPYGATNNQVVAALSATSLRTARTVTNADGARTFVTARDHRLSFPATAVASADVYQANYLGRVTQDPQMAPNYSFIGGSGSTVPGWIMPPAATLDAAQKHSNAQSLRIDQATTVQDASQSDVIYLGPFGQVTLTWWARTSGLPASSVHFDLEAFDASGASINTYADIAAAPIGGTLDWTQYSFTYTSDDRRWACALHFKVDLAAAPTGSVWIDDFTATRAVRPSPELEGML